MKTSRLILLLPLLLALLAACDSKKYEVCSSDRMFGNWGVSDKTDAFGVLDSLFYVFNPVDNVLDSIYYNGDYTDSYYHTDSTRVLMAYMHGDSILFSFNRQYAVQVNPKTLEMKVKACRDSIHSECSLTLRKDPDKDHLYRTRADSTFRNMLLHGGLLKFYATNGPSSAQPAGSQNYVFILQADGFSKALSLMDSLDNFSAKDTIKNKIY